MPSHRTISSAILLVGLASLSVLGAEAPSYGPEAALAFSRNYRGEVYRPDERTCYPGARGVPYADCENIIPMTGDLWTPAQIAADFRRRMTVLPANERKKGIIVLLKTERCAPKVERFCSTTTAALEKHSTPLVAEFLIYGVLLKPRDGDRPAGTLKIETGPDAWKNEAAGEYLFKQGPGATLAFLDPTDGSLLDHTNAALLSLDETNFQRNSGRTPELHAKLATILDQLRRMEAKPTPGR